jgi:hypothetical protein
VDLLVVDLVGLPDLELVGPPVDHEAHARVRDDRHVDAVAGAERRMRVPVRMMRPPARSFAAIARMMVRPAGRTCR